jgi:hypothetical protein
MHEARLRADYSESMLDCWKCAANAEWLKNAVV